MENLDLIYNFGEDYLLSIVPSWPDTPGVSMAFNEPSRQDLWSVTTTPWGSDEVFLDEKEMGSILPHRLAPKDLANWSPPVDLLGTEPRASWATNLARNWIPDRVVNQASNLRGRFGRKYEALPCEGSSTEEDTNDESEEPPSKEVVKKKWYFWK